MVISRGWRGGGILGSAMPSRTVKEVKRTGKRAIDRLPSHERMALFRAILRVAVYFVFCGSRQCRTSRVQRYPRELHWHVTRSQRPGLLHFEIYPSPPPPRSRLRAVQIFISRVPARRHEIFSFLAFVLLRLPSRLAKSKIEI